MIDWVLTSKIVYDSALIGTSLIAFRWGSFDEKLGATIALVASGITALVPPIAAALHFKGRYGFGAIDLATLIAFDAMMVRSCRFWPIWATGIQLAAIFLDLAYVLWPVAARAFVPLSQLWAYPILAMIAFASLRHRGKRARA